MKLAAARGPLVLAALSAIPVALWAQSAPLDTRFSGAFASSGRSASSS